MCFGSSLTLMALHNMRAAAPKWRGPLAGFGFGEAKRSAFFETVSFVAVMRSRLNERVERFAAAQHGRALAK